MTVIMSSWSGYWERFGDFFSPIKPFAGCLYM